MNAFFSFHFFCCPFALKFHGQKLNIRIDRINKGAFNSMLTYSC